MNNFSVFQKQKEKKKEETTPPAVSEMLNILGTLRRRPKTRASMQPPDPTQQLSNEATP